MDSKLEDLGNLLEEHGINIADIEFIVKYLASENISAQLAMRQIKSFKQLQAKLEDNEDKEKIKELTGHIQTLEGNLHQTQEELQNLQNAKEGLETEKEQLETQSVLLDSERDELRKQLELLKEMSIDDEEEETVEIEELSTFFETVRNKFSQSKYNSIAINLLSYLEENYADASLDGMNEPLQQFDASIDELVNKAKTQTTQASRVSSATSDVSRTMTSSGDSLVKPSDRLKQSSQTQTAKPDEEKITKKKTPKDDKDSKEAAYKKKVNQVLDLFIEFLEEADNDASFKERVSTICEMDEAYEYLGSIGLSQVYSFSSKGFEMKEELHKLFQSWKKDGVPR